MSHFIDSVKLIKLPHFIEENGDLVVMESLKNVPFKIGRVFIVRAPSGAIRGQHAHYECSQFLICSSGSVEVICDDGEQKKAFLLNNPNIGLLIPYSIWAQQNYIEPSSTLTVLCDQPYLVSDYIRDYELFVEYRKNYQQKERN